MNQRENGINVRIVLYGMAIIFSLGILFLGYTLTEIPYILSSIYDMITLPTEIQFIGHFKWVFNLFIILLSILPAIIALYLSEFGFSKYALKNEKR